MAIYSLAPAPRFGIASGAGYKIYTYNAGTLDAAVTYSTDAGIANANPIVANGAGLFGPIYLPVGSSFKFIFKTAADVTVWTQDGITAVPSPDDAADVSGVAGEDLPITQAAYLSDGSGGKNAGLWYRTDADFPYASTLPTVAYPTTAILLGNAGTFRFDGRIAGFSGLTAGTAYYLATIPGGLTASPPTNARFMGVADSATSLILRPGPQSAAIVRAGQWTPVVGGSGGTSGQTYTTQLGSYFKVGGLVMAPFTIVLSAKGTITGNVEIQGLPFTVDSTVAMRYISALVWAGLGTTHVNVIARVVSGTTMAEVRSATTASGNNTVQLVTADLTNGSQFEGTLIYQAV